MHIAYCNHKSHISPILNESHMWTALSLHMWRQSQTCRESVRGRQTWNMYDVWQYDLGNPSRPSDLKYLHLTTAQPKSSESDHIWHRKRCHNPKFQKCILCANDRQRNRKRQRGAPRLPSTVALLAPTRPQRNVQSREPRTILKQYAVWLCIIAKINQ